MLELKSIKEYITIIELYSILFSEKSIRIKKHLLLMHKESLKYQTENYYSFKFENNLRVKTSFFTQ